MKKIKETISKIRKAVISDLPSQSAIKAIITYGTLISFGIYLYNILPSVYQDITNAIQNYWSYHGLKLAVLNFILQKPELLQPTIDSLFRCLIILIYAYVFYLVFRRHAIERILHIIIYSWNGAYVHWFSARDLANRHMRKSLRKYSHATYIGISHDKLADYLSKAAEDCDDFNIEVVNVYFSNEVIGKIFEYRDFKNTIIENRKRIAQKLTELYVRKKFRNLKSINFYMSTCREYLISGSYYGNSDNDMKETYRTLLTTNKAAEESITMKIKCKGYSTKSEIQKLLINECKDIYSKIKESSVCLGKFHPNLWDISAKNWNEFCVRNVLMTDEMKALISFSKSRKVSILNKNILDVACASGTTSLLLLDEKPASITLADRSPAMLSIAESNVRAKNTKIPVTYALCTIPPNPIDNIGLGEKKYDIIILHQVLPSLAQTTQQLTQLATWCYNTLNEDGAVLLAVHNTVLSDIAHPKNTDSFREMLSEKLVQRFGTCIRKNSTPSPFFNSDEIYKVFCGGVRFKSDKNKDCTTRTFPVEINCRKDLWLCPAVADSLIDITKVDQKIYSDIVDEVAKLNNDKQSPRIVKYWIFRKIK